MEILFSTKHQEPVKPSQQIANFLGNKNELLEIDTADLVQLYDQISKYWMSRQCRVSDILAREGMGFLVPWLNKSNINKLLNQNFQNLSSLDNPQYDSSLRYYLYARPVGVSVHWIAGNVPVLGVISLFQTLITKNKSIVKVPLSFKNILPTILNDLLDNPFFSPKMSNILNSALRQVIIVYVERNDIAAQRELSMKADIRICWGGIDAVDSIMGLPKKINCRDLVFGPKISLGLVTSESLKSSEDLKKLAGNLANDVFSFNQAGCNAPHNLIIEKGSNFNLDEISREIGKEFEKKSFSNPQLIEPIDTFNLLVKEFIYHSNEDLNMIQSPTKSWNIFIHHRALGKLPDPLYLRSIFISEIGTIAELGQILPENTQSIGLLCSESRKPKLIKQLSQYYADRFPDLGKMSLYQNPWDGYLPMQEMVRWISSN
jgi:hypothetical protein